MDNEHFPVGTVIADYKRQIRDLETMLAETQKSARAWQNDNHELHRRLEEAQVKHDKLWEIVVDCRVSVLIPGEMIEYMDEVWIPAKKHEQVVNKATEELQAELDDLKAEQVWISASDVPKEPGLFLVLADDEMRQDYCYPDGHWLSCDGRVEWYRSMPKGPE